MHLKSCSNWQHKEIAFTELFITIPVGFFFLPCSGLWPQSVIDSNLWGEKRITFLSFVPKYKKHSYRYIILIIGQNSVV